MPLASLAVLADERPNWRPHQFQDQLWGCGITFQFPTVKLLDYEPQWQQLEDSSNPFATVVMTHLKAKQTRNNPQQRQIWKFALTRRLYERGYQRQDVLNLYRFIDWLLELPEGLEQSFQADLQQLEQERQMPYITSIERRAKQEGVKEGVKEGSRKEALLLILKLLSRKIGNLTPEVRSQIEALSLPQLEDLGEALLDFSTTADLTDWLRCL